MTRKRFIRLVMAEGIQRNRANEIARTVQKSGVPYADAYSTMMNPFIKLRKSWEKMQEAALRAGDAIRRVLQKINEAVESAILYGMGGQNDEDLSD